jgi:NAD(P)-dependent dehydrogenase (short-subunit alcohol dehydrogenase family)
LRERLLASAPARVVSVASEAHRGVTLDFDDLQSAENYSGWPVYRRSKLCNILFTRELARRLAGTGVTANCVHPGFVASRFGDNNSGVYGLGIRIAKALFAISQQNGAKTSVYVATAAEPGQVSGRYYAKERQAEPSVEAQDDAAAARLWDVTARLVGL